MLKHRGWLLPACPFLIVPVAAAAGQGAPAVAVQDVGTALAIRDGIAAWERGDDAEAVRLWLPHAEAGDPDAQFNLAQAYRLGRGVPADPARAVELYRRAAVQGHVAAAANYGIMLYAEGEQARAMPLLVRAADAGDARARYVVGLAHFNGDLLPRDWPRAYALVMLAADAGLHPAKSAMSRMEAHLQPAQMEEGRALAVFMASSAAAGEAQAGGIASELPVSRTVAQAAALPSDNPPADAVPASPVLLQLGAFAGPDNAEGLRARLEREPSLRGYTIAVQRTGRLAVVTAHGFADLATAQAVCRELQARGFECLAKR